MSKIIYKIISLPLLLILCAGCTMYNEMKYEENPRLDTVNNLYNGYVQSFFRITELTDFFHTYQSLRNDREASLKLADDYFGDSLRWGELYYEYCHVFPWGKISQTASKDTYIIDSRTLDWSYYMEEREVVVKVIGDRKYEISVRGKKDIAPVLRDVAPPKYETLIEFAADCVTSVSDEGIIVVEEFEMIYEEALNNSSTEVQVRSMDKPLQMPLCQKGTYSIWPVSGKLGFKLFGDVANDVFDVEFSADRMNILSDDGSDWIELK